LGIGDGKNEKTCSDFMEVFHRNLNDDRRKTLLNLKLLFGDESFLFSNLIFAVFYMIFEYLFESSPEVCPLAYMQIVLLGDPFQLLVFDKDRAGNRIASKNHCFAKGVRDMDGEQFFSNFFEKLMLTGLRVCILTKCHRTNDSSFLETLNIVSKINNEGLSHLKVFVFYFSLIEISFSRFEVVHGMNHYVTKYHDLEKVMVL